MSDLIRREDALKAAEQAELDAEFVKAGIKAYNCGVDITSKMEYEITSNINEYNHKEYTVIYRIFDENGKSAVVTVCKGDSS